MFLIKDETYALSWTLEILERWVENEIEIEK